MRVLGVDRPAAQVLTDALRHGAPLQRRGSAPGGQEMSDDYALIDPLLHVEEPVDPACVPRPRGTGYAGMTPAQRGVFLAWLADPRGRAGRLPQLYLAHLEVHLLESTPVRARALNRLFELQAAPGWQRHHDLYRAILLGCWLTGASDPLVDWLAATRLPGAVLEVALACQAQFDTPLTPPEFGQMLATWGMSSVDLPVDMLKTRLASLEATLGAPPLAYVQSQWQAADLVPRPWRCAPHLHSPAAAARAHAAGTAPARPGPDCAGARPAAGPIRRRAQSRARRAGGQRDHPGIRSEPVRLFRLRPGVGPTGGRLHPTVGRAPPHRLPDHL
ncbi:MAG: hypothetical protein R2851_22885 [Caldilineaceae bacterium]